MDHRSLVRSTTRGGRRILVAVAGFAVLGAGIAMLVLPGPGIAAIIAGLAILGTEFHWARRLLTHAKAYAHRTAQKVRNRRGTPPGDLPGGPPGDANRAA